MKTTKKIRRRVPERADSLAFLVFLANLQFVVQLEKTKLCSILFNNMGAFNRKNEIRKVENIDKPTSSN